MNADPKKRIVGITLDERSLVRYNAHITKERETAIRDLLEQNYFDPKGDFSGPFHLLIGKDEQRIILDIQAEDKTPLLTVGISLSPLRHIIKDYFLQCESYFKGLDGFACGKLEAIDMGRRAIHNEGSEVLQEKLSDAVAIDKATARALFTLICVLHIRG